MSDFIFPCSQCGQHIQYDDGYVGCQINCPTCQASIIVPPTANGPAVAGKSGAGTWRTVLISLAVLVACAGLAGGGWYLYAKHQAKLGNPAAQVSKPSASAAAGAKDILTKVQQAYSSLKSLSVEGTSVMIMDMSRVTAADLNPGQRQQASRQAKIPKAMTNRTEVSIKLAQPDLYRIEGAMKMAVGSMNMTNTTAVWSTGKTNYVLMMFSGFKNFSTVPDRRTAIMRNGQAGGLAMAIPQLFFGEADDMLRLIKDWGRTEDATVNGQDCCTLTGKLVGQKLKIWVSKANSLVLQSQITLGGAVSDADIDTAIGIFGTDGKKTPAQLEQEKTMARQQAAIMTKIRGVVTETYDSVETNPAFAAADFNYPVPAGVELNARPSMNARAGSTSSRDSQRNACINNLRQLDAAKNQWALEKGKTTGAAATEADIKPYIKLDAAGNLPKCPAGGKYTIGKVGENPVCSIPGHALQ